MNQISKLIEFDRLARKNGRTFTKKRFLFADLLNNEGNYFIGIAGSRGSGKTTLLKQLALEKQNSFYLSLDTLKDDLFETVKKLNSDMKIDFFLLDEVHFNPSFNEGLKKIYDFLNVKVIFTSSVALSLFESAYDLSRRVLIKKLYPFSFREYLFFKYNKILKALTLSDIMKKNWNHETIEFIDSFPDYLQGGIFPFALNTPDPLPLLKNIVNTVIRKDIPAIAKLTTNELDIIDKLLKFIGRSKIDGISYSCLSKNLGITKYKAEQYVNLLEKAFILHCVKPTGTNVLKEPKILMTVPYRLLYSNYKSSSGGIREDFFVEMMRSLDLEFYYLKSLRGAKTPDYYLPSNNNTGNIVIEIGGKNKGLSQFKGITIECDKIIFTPSIDTHGIKRPLFLLGMM